MPQFCPECGMRFATQVACCPNDGTRTVVLNEAGDLLGRVLDGRYSLDAIIGCGGMGTVYRARHLSMDRDVALKVLRPDTSYREDSIRRFFREARAASRLRSPHAVTVFDFGQGEDGLFFLAMELLHGMPLSAAMGAGPLAPARAVRIADQVLEVLEEAHAAGIVHRDLKPDNIFLLDRPPDHVKVLDFGLARMVHGETLSQATTQGATHGTPAYMSPEQAFGRPLDGRSDLYSLGLLLFEMLTGRPAFRGDSSLELMLHRTRQAAPRLSEASGIPLPRLLEDVVAGLLARDPSDRIPGATAARNRLRDVLALLPVPAAGAAGPDAPSRAEGTRPVPTTPPAADPGMARFHDALKVALALEEEGRRLYLDAMARSRSAPAREVFHHLMEEEVVHTETFRALGRSLAAGCWVEPSPNPPDADLGGLFVELARGCSDAVRNDAGLVEALELGIALEHRVVEFWEQRVAAAVDPRERRFAERMVDEEQGHVAALAEIRAHVASLAGDRPRPEATGQEPQGGVP